MSYFVTGATGFIGRFLVEKLLARDGEVFVLVRRGSVKKLEELQVRWGAQVHRVVPVIGDLAKPNLGVSAAEIAKLKGKVKHFFHLAAIYDLAADAESQEKANIDGTRHAVELAAALDAGCFHHVSSIAAAGLYDGTFREDMFEEAEELDHPYFRTKHDSEGIVRTECKAPWRVYRPAIVVGHSKTGEIDKIDGPYYFFKLIQKMRNALPPWVPTVGIEGGAQVVLVARDPEKAAPVLERIAQAGGKARFVSCDLSELGDCDKLVATVIKEFGHIDYLVNNAGRSIRRGIGSSYDRFHDFERTMQLNYFGSLRLIMGFMPTMVAQGGGHIINISSIGVLTRAPRFSAYVASKAALDAFSDCAASEFIDNNVHFTTINMPLVKTPMIAPTKLYNHVPTLTPEQAADLVVEAIIHKPVRIATRLGVFGEILHAVAPKVTQIILNTAFRMFPDSGAAKGKKGEEAKEVELSPEQIAFAQITQGIHWEATP